MNDGPALRMRFGLGEAVAIVPRWNVAPGDEVLTAGRDGGALRRWGYLADSAYSTINARAESLMERPVWRNALADGRCLVLADGFYEWQRLEGRKQPFWIARADRAPFAFAGLASPWGTCAIVTTAATPGLEAIHPRMPVMLDETDEDAWLSGEVGPAEAHALLRGYEDTIALPVADTVNDARHDAPDCLDPAPEPPPTLF